VEEGVRVAGARYVAALLVPRANTSMAPRSLLFAAAQAYVIERVRDVGYLLL
jgi:hypothetical protein